jgi:hypothetical protein
MQQARRRSLASKVINPLLIGRGVVQAKCRGWGLVGWGRNWRAWPGGRRYVLPLMSRGLLIQKAPHTPERR